MIININAYLVNSNNYFKNGFYKKPFFIKYNLQNNFFNQKFFNLNRRFFEKKYVLFHSRKFKRSKIGKKFKIFCKSERFKKLVNYKKHYKKFLQIKKIRDEFNAISAD